MSNPSLLRAAPPAQAPDTSPSVSGGKALWTENCQPCHGPAGKGDGPASQNIPNPLPDFSNPVTAGQFIPGQNFNVIKNGRIDKLMPPWGNRLSDAQIWDLTAYVWSLSVKPDDLAAGETIYTDQCAACHGSRGAGDGPEATANMVSFTDLSAMIQRSQADLQASFKASQSHTTLNGLSDPQLGQVLNYIRTFSFKLPQRNGILKGQVINATINKPQGNLEVTLRIFEGNTEIDRMTTQADSAGNYTFEKLATDHSILYAVEGRYKDIVYLSDQPGLFTPNSIETILNLNVYETSTTNAEAINVPQLHYLMSFTPETINVVQIFVVGNKGKETYIGTNGRTFSFVLPQNAQEVNFEGDPSGTRFIESDGGYVDTTPIPPGAESLSIVASYKVPYHDMLTLSIPLPADVTSTNVMMQEQGAKLSSDQLQFVESRQFQNDSFSIYSAANLKKDQILTLNLTDLNHLTFSGETDTSGNNTPGGSFNQDQMRWIVVGLGGLVIVFVAVGYPYLRPQLTHQTPSDEDPNLRRQKLLLLLARLDEAFEAGELDKQIYHRARAKYKAELVQLMER